MTSNALLFEDSSAPPTPNRNFSPFKLIVFLAAIVFLAEITTMLILYFLQLPNYAVITFVDGALMLLLIFPGLYYLQLKPILRKMEEHAQAEKALRISEAHLKKVLEALPVGVLIINRKGEVVHGNPAAKEIWAGLKHVGFEGYGVYKARWADTGELVKPEEWGASRAIARGETSIDEEVNIEAFDGTQKIMLNSAVPILDDEKAIQGVVVVNQDITLRRQMEKELVRTNELLGRFFNSIHTLTAFLDNDFNFVMVNQAYAEASGHTIDYFSGKNHFELYPHEENQLIFRQVVETGQPYTVFEKPFEYPDYPERGVTYWDWSLQPVKGTDNKVEGLVFSLLDVTRRKLAELQLERQNFELRELTKTEHRQRVFAEGLVQSVMVLNTSLELDQVLYSVLEQTRKAIPFQGADIILVKAETWHLAAFLGFEDFPEVRHDFDISYTFDGYPLLQQVYSSQQMLVLDCANETPGWRTNPDMAWVRSFSAVPLLVNGDVMGMIELYSEQNAAFNQDTADRLVAFATPAALAIHNARLYQAESEARQFAEAMSAAAQALSQTLDLDHAVNILLDHIQMIVNSDTAGVTLNEGEGRWVMRELRGYNGWASQEEIPRFPLDVINIIQGITMTQKSLVLPGISFSMDQALENSTEPIKSWAILPIIASDKVVGFVELGKAGNEIIRPEQIQWVEALVLQTSVAIQNAWLFDQVRSSSLRLQSLARKLVELQENERSHIARELHDEAGQALSLLKLSLARLEQDPACPLEMRQRLLLLMGVTDGVLEDLHRLAMDLRPVALDHLGLVAALEQLANQLNSEGISIKFKAIGIEERLPHDVEISLYRIAQEALTNVMRHAQASSVGVLLEYEGGVLKLFIEDDGIGFTPDNVEKTDQLGLVGMRERAEMLGGCLIIESSPDSGTSIIVEVPDAKTYPYHR